VGADRGKRALSVVEQDGQRIAVDGDGRPVGRLP
jgi:osmoprotectant transport system ATP-binding protein